MEFVNIFSGGINQDLDTQQRPNNTYENAICGRIIFNVAGDLSFENAQGNKYYFSLPAGYIPIGGNEFPDCLVIYSTNNNNSEIGLLRIDTQEIPSYVTVFNDAFDFNGDKLGFRADKLITKAWGVIESISKQRTYFTDFYNEERVFNIVAGLQVNNPDFTQGDYQPLLNGKYPWWYSVHSMSLYADWLPGRIKFVRKGNAEDSPGEASGSLKSGVFQYSYRMVTREGYYTVWYPLTRHIFLTTVDIDTIGNAHDYFMDASNIMTPYSIWLELKNVDSRFWKMEVAYVYTIAKTATLESFIFDSILLDGITTDYNVQHIAHGGTPVDLQEYNAYPVAIIKALTVQEKNQRLFWGNIETIGDLSIDTSLISIEPLVKALFNPDSDGRFRVDIPLTNVNVGSNTTSLVSYLDSSLNPVSEIYKIVHDFLTYQGMQVEHLYPGYWRGETYPFGILLYDRKGIPFFVQNIQDFTFPNQYDSDGNSPAGFPYKLTDDTASTNIQVLGATFNGITIPYSVLYDSMGRQRVSGFSIVRCLRKPRVLFQGILLDTVYDTSEDSGKATRPLPAHVEEPFSVAHGTDSFQYDTNYIPSAGSGAWANRPYTMQLHSPELSFGFPVYQQTGQAGLQETDYLELLGVVRSTYELGDLPKTLELNKTAKHNSYYTKHYTTIIDGIPLYDVGARSRMKNTIQPGFNDDPSTGNIKIIGYDFDNIAFYFQNGDDTYFTATLPGGHLHHCLGCIGSWVVKTKDFKLLDSGFDTSDRATRYSIVNYNAPSSNYYNTSVDENGKTIIGERIFISTGHFQPINAAVIANVQKHFSDDSPSVPDGLIFDGVQVFGGDCFVNLFDFVRLYPKYSYGDNEYDYAFGVIVPLESNLNHSLRKGRSLAKDGIEPNKTAQGLSTDFTNGASSNQPEEFNINDVLLHQENIQFFPSLPEDRQVINNQFRNRWVYTELKFYGEIQDNYRKILANNFQDVIGIYGDITGSLLWKDQIYSFQAKGWGRLRQQDRTLIPAENPQAVVTGAGGILDGIDYFSHFYGTQHTLSLCANEYSMYWVDVNNRAICKYNAEGQQALTDTKGLHDWAQFVLSFYDKEVISFDGTAYINIQTVFDITMNEILFVFASSQRFIAPKYPVTGTLVYNENMDAFTNFYPNFSLWNIKYRNLFFSNNLADRVKIYRHNFGNYGEFYETVYDTVLTFTVNPSADITKKFDNIFCNINAIGATLLKSVKFETEDQVLSIPDFQNFVDPLSGKKKWTYRFNDLIFPIFDVLNLQRAQGKTCRVTLTFANNGLNKLKISSNKTMFRIAQNITTPKK